MVEYIDFFDRMFRRNGRLPRLSWLRNWFRKSYHRLLELNSAGLPLAVGGLIQVRVPPRFCSREVESYERETVAAIHSWVLNNSGGVFVDIGCSFGYLSCAVLFADPAAEVIAVDADLPSLAVTRFVCSHCPSVQDRLQLYHTLIGNDSGGKETMAALRHSTADKLNDPSVSADPAATSYINLDTELDVGQIPRISLDRFLLESLERSKRPWLIKCDVEGAEQIVLEGARRVMLDFRPTLLLSVHPPYLPRFSGSPEQIRNLLTSNGYSIDVIGVDHEEHWLCT
jgi:FkbM family methyltransferase